MLTQWTNKLTFPFSLSTCTYWTKTLFLSHSHSSVLSHSSPCTHALRVSLCCSVMVAQSWVEAFISLSLATKYSFSEQNAFAGVINLSLEATARNWSRYSKQADYETWTHVVFMMTNSFICDSSRRIIYGNRPVKYSGQESLTNRRTYIFWRLMMASVNFQRRDPCIQLTPQRLGN